MSEPAEQVRTLHGWIELVDCSVIWAADAVTQDILLLTEGDPNWESDGVLWNEDSTTIVGLEFLRWNEAPPDMSVFFAPVCRHLRSEEYLTFECKFKFGRLTSTLMVVLVSGRGVYTADGYDLAKEIMKLSILGKNTETTEGEQSLL